MTPEQTGDLLTVLGVFVVLWFGVLLIGSVADYLEKWHTRKPETWESECLACGEKFHAPSQRKAVALFIAHDEANHL